MNKARVVKNSSKKPGKRPAAPKKTSKKKAAAPVLDRAARQRLLKMRSDSDDVIERVVIAWSSVKGLRVTKLTPARLRALLAKVKRAQAKEDALRAKVEAALRALGDARMIAEDAAYRALLDVNAAVKLAARGDASVAKTFSFLSDHLRGDRGDAPVDPAPVDPAPSP